MDEILIIEKKNLSFINVTIKKTNHLL